MFARIVSMPLKSGAKSEFGRAIENEVIPLLRTHKGFLDEIALVYSDGKTAFGISFWDSKESAEAYHRAGFAVAMKPLESVVSGPTQVQLCEVPNSTAHKIAAAATAR